MAAEDANDAAVHPPEFSWLCRHLSERSPQPMLALEGPEHLVVYLNPAFAAFFGQPAEVRLGQPFAEAVLEGVENGCLGMLDRVFATGVSETLLDQEHLQRDGSPAWWSYLAWAVPGEGGRPTGVLVQVTDATEVVRFRARSTAMNEALLVSSVRQHELAEVAESLAERLQGSLRARDHFIAALSHELRNPLAPLTVGVELLSRAATPRRTPSASGP